MERIRTGETVTHEHVAYDQERRLYDDTTTWLAEVLEGSMRTPFEYQFDGKELRARDGGAMGPIFHGAVAEARRIATEQPNLNFELRRRLLEMEEYELMLAMAKGEAPNTMIVVSDFPPELMDAKEDVGGYNAGRKQTMLRVLTWANGTMTMRSQSLDHSDRRALEAMYTSMGLNPEATELLGQRIHVDLTKEDQLTIIDYLTGQYDQAMTAQYGGSWYAGRKGEKRINTYEFVCQQQDLIAAYMKHNQLAYVGDMALYSLAAAMKARFEMPQAVMLSPQFDESPWALQQAVNEMNRAGQRAMSLGQIFTGCGLTLGTNTEADGPKSDAPDVSDELAEAGYGNKTSESTSYKFDKYSYCRLCQAPPKSGEDKKMCGPCKICRDCDKVAKRTSKK